MRATRSLAGIAAGAVLATGLVAGGASAAQADPHPPLHFPTCTQAMPPEVFETGAYMDGYVLYHPSSPSSIRYGTSNTAIVNWIKSHTNRSCTWYRVGKFSEAATASEVKLSSAQLHSLLAYYERNHVTGESFGGPALSYAYESPTHPGWIQRDTVFADGTVDFTLDRSGMINGAFSQDIDDVLITMNPWIN